MKSVKINECIFNKILVSLKGNLSKDWQRPTLQFIRLDVKKDKIIGYSVDGYTAGRIIIPCVKPNPDEFTAYIKPIPFKETPSGIQEVVISVDNGLASVEIMQEEKQCYTFKMPESFGVNIEKIWKDEDYADEEIYVNALLLAKSLKTLSATHYDPQHRAVIKIKKNKTKPIIARAMCEDIQIDQLILPIRNMKEVNVEEKVSREKEFEKQVAKTKTKTNLEFLKNMCSFGFMQIIFDKITEFERKHYPEFDFEISCKTEKDFEEWLNEEYKEWIWQ